MSIITSQQLSRFYEEFKGTEVTFNKQVIAATGLLPRHVFIKIADQQWPCVIYSSSMTGARSIAGVKADFFESLRNANNHASLRYCFKMPEKTDPISFFVPSKVSGYTQYNPKNPDVQLITMEFNQRPPDDLIMVLGALLEASANAQKRKDERIVLTPETLKRLGLESKDSIVYVEAVPRKCIIRDLSFGGAKVLVTGIAKFLKNKPAALKLVRAEVPEEIQIPGEILRVENVEGRSDIVALAILYTEDPPLSYKLMINGYLTAVRKGAEPPTISGSSPSKPAPKQPAKKPEGADKGPENTPQPTK
jgi:hypothetical protein